jgi:hypothetical protein
VCKNVFNVELKYGFNLLSNAVDQDQELFAVLYAFKKKPEETF